jgi:hypothetical protein
MCVSCWCVRNEFSLDAGACRHLWLCRILGDVLRYRGKYSVLLLSERSFLRRITRITKMVRLLFAFSEICICARYIAHVRVDCTLHSILVAFISFVNTHTHTHTHKSRAHPSLAWGNLAAAHWCPKSTAVVDVLLRMTHQHRCRRRHSSTAKHRSSRHKCLLLHRRM